MPNNDRLVPLGQKLLECVVVDELYHRYPDYDEGAITGITHRICSKYSIFDYARAIKLHIYSFALPVSLLGEARGDGFRALVAVMYIDGGFDTVKAFLLREMETGLKNPRPVRLYQNELRECMREHFGRDFVYIDISSNAGIM